jgi:rhodanese-related sulfurtransferase
MASDVQVHHLDLDTVRAGLDDGSMLIIDVREPHEFAMGHMPGAVSMPLSSFDPDALPRADGKRIVFSCAAGVRSMQALAMAQEAGVALSEHYRGGFREWAMMGEPIEA